MATANVTVQQGLNEVVMNKVQKMIDGNAVGVQATMERLVNEGKIAQDYIATIGVLSDSYRRLNSVEILTAFVQEAAGQGAVISDAYMNDTKVWAETILSQPIVVPTVNNGDVIIFAGARFSTSDYGGGAVNFEEITNYRIPKEICVALLRIASESLIFCNKNTQPRLYKERTKEVENFIKMMY